MLQHARSPRILSRSVLVRRVQRVHRPYSVYSRTPEPAPPEVAHLLATYAQHTPRPLTLGTLLATGRSLTPESVLTSVSYAQAEIPRRLATRIRSLESLPFIVGTNPYIARVLHGFRKSFLWSATYPQVKNMEENAIFTAQLEALVQDHANDLLTMAKGFQECAKYMSSEHISNFLDAAIRNRIAVRLIAEQHIVLSHALQNPEQANANVGIVNMALSPVEMIRMCASFVSELCEASLGAAPPVIIDGATDATFAYVPIHMEYILTEILKNAFRATVEQDHSDHHRYLKYKQQEHQGQQQNNDGSGSGPIALTQHNEQHLPLPPVLITIVPPPRLPNISKPATLTLRIRDQGGGVTPRDMERIFSYSFTTAGRRSSSGSGRVSSVRSAGDGGGPYAAQQHVGAGGAVAAAGVDFFSEITSKGIETGLGTIAGLGFGLPMSRLYAQYFGGSLDLFSLDGWGSDVLLKLRCLDDAHDVEI